MLFDWRYRMHPIAPVNEPQPRHEPRPVWTAAASGWSHTEAASGDRATYKLNFWHIRSDEPPAAHLLYRTDPEGHDFDHSHLNLKWRLPSVAECPVLVWDPTFHALPARTSRREGQGDGGVRDLRDAASGVVRGLPGRRGLHWRSWQLRPSSSQHKRKDCVMPGGIG